jgi:hypothetical protein
LGGAWASGGIRIQGTPFYATASPN